MFDRHQIGLWRVMLCCIVVVLISNVKAAQTFDKGLLWQVSKTGMKPSFVFGTIHSEDKRVLALLKNAPGIKAQNADAVIIETELDANSTAVFMQAMFFTDGRRMSQLLSPVMYKRAIAAGATRGLPADQLDLLKPWALMTVLAMPTPETGMFLDLTLYKSAVSRGARVAGLETPQEQIAAMDGLTMNDQVVLLEDTIEQFDELPKLLEALTQAYLKRDLAAMETMYEEYASKNNKDVEERLKTRILLKRNDVMVERMQKWLASGNSFIAVGALHLPGERGILRQLHDKGWTMKVVY